MSSQNIRDLFIKFFEKHGHEKIPSSSLIPQNDPSLLFANAGMNQFKDYFTGRANPRNKRAVTIQKCVRAGGKHNDLENVGMTARHHTFFEMLGNFSFGDYFKQESIDFAWIFLTEYLNLPEEKLYITVHKSDSEAFDLWRARGISRERIFYLGDKDNFWEMGKTGPCGPCSEVFYDHGEQYGRDSLSNEERFVEIWNLVFMQYEKYEDNGAIKKRRLPSPSVDTGAGLERIAAVMQGAYWNYDTDLFIPIIQKLEKISRKNAKDSKSADSFRIISDHIRSSVMLITDGVVPSNEGRGYVLRRIIRRAIRHARKLDAPDNTLYKLVESVFSILGEEYPQNKQGLSTAQKLLEIEEKKFLETLDHGIHFLNEALKTELIGGTLKGNVIFKLYDTFGFPPDLTELMLKEKSLKADMQTFHQLMEERKKESRKLRKIHSAEDNTQFHRILDKYGKTEFLGYTQLCATGTLLEIIDIDEATKGLIFDQTPFYGQSGGQIGDRGLLKTGDQTVGSIRDVQIPVKHLFVHFIKGEISLKKGTSYTLQVDEQRRSFTTKNHSATHLLQSALIKTLGPHIKQAGSSVNHEKLRFDFTHHKALTKEEISLVEDTVNSWIQEALPVTFQHMDMNEAFKQGAVAFFEDKYENPVRVLKMGQASIELCGGTHVGNTSEIVLFKITDESSLGSGVRRIESLTAQMAVKFLKDRSCILESLEKNLQDKGPNLIKKVDSLQEEVKERGRQIKELKRQLRGGKIHDIFQNPENINGVGFITTEISQDIDLRELSDSFVSRFPKGVALFYCLRGESFNVLLRSSKGLSLNCSDILKVSLKAAKGRGGGRADMAQGSGKSQDIRPFLSEIKNLISLSLHKEA